MSRSFFCEKALPGQIYLCPWDDLENCQGIDYFLVTLIVPQVRPEGFLGKAMSSASERTPLEQQDNRGEVFSLAQMERYQMAYCG